MPRLRLETLPTSLAQDNLGPAVAGKLKTGTSLASHKLHGPSLKPRTILGDLHCANKVGLTHQNAKQEVVAKKVKTGTTETLKKIPQYRVQSKPENIEPVKQSTESIQEVQSLSSKLLNIVDIDSDNDNPQLVSYYAKDIYRYLNQLEVSYAINANYMEGYKIRPSMRTILVDWLVDVHGRFKMLQETLYLTVTVMDAFLQVDSTIDRSELQLVGLTAMLIAAKFEETWAPEINDFVYMSDKAYSVNDILRMECRMLKTLDFKLGRPLPLHFLRRNTQAASQTIEQVDVLHHTLSKYLMELTLPEYGFCYYLPSELAAAALCLSLGILDENNTSFAELWNDSMVYYSGYSLDRLEPLMAKLCQLVVSSETSKFQAVRNKYTSSKFYNISAIHHLKSPLVRNFAKKVTKLIS